MLHKCGGGYRNDVVMLVVVVGVVVVVGAVPLNNFQTQ